MEQVGLAVALAAADDPNQLPLRGAERKAVEARQVGRLQLCLACSRDAMHHGPAARRPLAGLQHTRPCCRISLPTLPHPPTIAWHPKQEPAPDLTLLVCCHAARDARCGQVGPPLVAALRRLVRRHGLEGQVEVLATSHVGGHKYAGNVVAYGAVHPCDGDWFGGVNAGNAAAFLEALLGMEVRRVGWGGGVVKGGGRGSLRV